MAGTIWLRSERKCDDNNSMTMTTMLIRFQMWHVNDLKDVECLTDGESQKFFHYFESTLYNVLRCNFNIHWRDENGWDMRAPSANVRTGAGDQSTQKIHNIRVVKRFSKLQVNTTKLQSWAIRSMRTVAYRIITAAAAADDDDFDATATSSLWYLCPCLCVCVCATRWSHCGERTMEEKLE